MPTETPGINGIVIVESPYRGDGSPEAIQINVEFARNVCRDLISKGYAPYASHLFFPGILNEEEERQTGIALGFQIAAATAPEKVVFALRNLERWSEGMIASLDFWYTNMKETGYPNDIVRARYTQEGEFLYEEDVSL